MELIPTTRYNRSFRKLTKNNKPLGESIIKTLLVFKNSPGKPSLRLHKLSNLNTWRISVNMSIRIIFLYQQDKVILLYIGDHSIYD